jgi:hypothetical protein
LFVPVSFCLFTLSFPRVPMLIHLNDREAEIMALALRYWRSRRTRGSVRRDDPVFLPDTIDFLLAKLGLRTPGVRPPRIESVNARTAARHEQAKVRKRA